MKSRRTAKTLRGAIALAGSVVVGALVLTPVAAGAATTPVSVTAEVVKTAIAPQVTKNVGGGLWQYGRDGAPFGTSWSNYHHPTKYHSATACNGSIFQTCKQVTAAKDKWAKAKTAASPTFNTAYWNTY